MAEVDAVESEADVAEDNAEFDIDVADADTDAVELITDAEVAVATADDEAEVSAVNVHDFSSFTKSSPFAPVIGVRVIEHVSIIGPDAL